jgi:hypothetical protein
VWRPSKDHRDYQGRGRWELSATEPDDDDDGPPDPMLLRPQRWALMGILVGLWAVAMAILDVHWWDFDEHGPWLTPLTPIVLTSAVERIVMHHRPDWNRHLEAEDRLAARSRLRASQLGDRARPYWARESVLTAGETGDIDFPVPRLDDLAVPPTILDDPPGDAVVSARTRRSP